MPARSVTVPRASRTHVPPSGRWDGGALHGAGAPAPPSPDCAEEEEHAVRAGIAEASRSKQRRMASHFNDVAIASCPRLFAATFTAGQDARTPSRGSLPASGSAPTPEPCYPTLSRGVPVRDRRDPTSERRHPTPFGWGAHPRAKEINARASLPGHLFVRYGPASEGDHCPSLANRQPLVGHAPASEGSRHPSLTLGPPLARRAPASKGSRQTSDAIQPPIVGRR